MDFIACDSVLPPPLTKALLSDTPPHCELLVNSAEGRAQLHNSRKLGLLLKHFSSKRTRGLGGESWKYAVFWRTRRGTREQGVFLPRRGSATSFPGA